MAEKCDKCKSDLVLKRDQYGESLECINQCGFVTYPNHTPDTSIQGRRRGRREGGSPTSPHSQDQ